MTEATNRDLIRCLVEHNRDGTLVIDETGRIVTHNRALVELLGEPAGTQFATTVRLGRLNLRRILIRAAIAAGEQDAAGRPSHRHLDFHTELDHVHPPLPIRIVSTALPSGPDGQRLRLVTLRVEEPPPGSPRTPDTLPAGRSVLVSADRNLQRRIDLARQAASDNTNLLILGETGTGKTALARGLHHVGRRRNGPWIVVPCGAIPDAAAERELFGHAPDAFPGTRVARPGRVETAHGGTLLLDEVASATPRLQQSLLSALDGNGFPRTGETGVQRVDIHVIATSNAHLAERVTSGEFRADLYFRLAGHVLELPPLRERPRDLAATVDTWARTRSVVLASELRNHLLKQPWPGNFWQLHATLRALLRRSEPNAAVVGLEALPDGRPPPPASAQDSAGETDLPGFSPEERAERRLLEEALATHNGNRTLAAKSLGMDRTTLWRKLHRLRLTPSGGQR